MHNSLKVDTKYQERNYNQKEVVIFSKNTPKEAFTYFFVCDII